jgi:hypothetical protein
VGCCSVMAMVPTYINVLQCDGHGTNIYKSLSLYQAFFNQVKDIQLILLSSFYCAY